MEDERKRIEQAKTDPRAFGQLYELYYPKIFGYVFRLSGDYHISCDITSETFVKAFLKINSFKWRSISISSWFFKIATNELNQYFRRKKYTPFTLTDFSVYEALPEVAQLKDEAGSTLSTMEVNGDFENLRKRLHMLSPDDQKVIALRYFEGMSIRDISEILGKKEGTVKSLLSRGVEKLRKLF